MTGLACHLHVTPSIKNTTAARLTESVGRSGWAGLVPQWGVSVSG